jgi:hypothetical protein
MQTLPKLVPCELPQNRRFTSFPVLVDGGRLRGSARGAYPTGGNCRDDARSSVVCQRLDARRVYLRQTYLCAESTHSSLGITAVEYRFQPLTQTVRSA